MSELGEIFGEWKKEKQEKKRSNATGSLAILDENKITYKRLSLDHFRVGEFDFWPSTGLFIHLKTKWRGRGVFNLIRQLNKEVE